MKGGLTDPERILNGREQGRVRKALRRYERQLPQLEFHVALLSVPAEIKVGCFAFWLFNGSGVCSDLHKGGLNFHSLLLIDTDHCRAHLSVGYGLEPFVREEELSQVLHQGAEALSGELYAEAVDAVVEGAIQLWHAKGDLIPRAFGLRRKERDSDHTGW